MYALATEFHSSGEKYSDAISYQNKWYRIYFTYTENNQLIERVSQSLMKKNREMFVLVLKTLPQVTRREGVPYPVIQDRYQVESMKPIAASI